MYSSAPLVPITITITPSLTRILPLPPPLLKPHFLSYKFKPLICHCSTSDREEQRWLREEQRWLREEQRWLREEHRWNREREELLREISELKLQIQSLEHRLISSSSTTSPVSDAVANVASLLQVLKDKNLALESGSNQRRIVFEQEEEKESEDIVEHEKEILVVEETTARVEKRRVLRTGSEGEDVRQLQEALLKLGFYSGEEDMEYSCFSSGTERAVKTWQASLDVPEDGIMTADLLERLFLEIRTTDTGKANINKKSTTSLPKGGENGAAVASVTEISELQQKAAGNDDIETKASHPRVFLLGENRWEEPSRLVPNDDAVDRGKKKGATIRCLQCGGEGRLLCTECDGTGEPNIEPQFLEWVGEDTKCPYCEGLGYSICDLCSGKTLLSGMT